MMLDFISICDILYHMKPIIIKSRYGALRMITLVDIANDIYSIQGESEYLNCSDEMRDFEGGPSLYIGNDFYGLGTIKEFVNNEQFSQQYAANDLTEAIVYIAVEPTKIKK